MSACLAGERDERLRRQAAGLSGCGLVSELDLTGDGQRESVGYDTTGDGLVDALDTNGDGSIDARIVHLPAPRLAVSHEQNTCLYKSSALSADEWREEEYGGYAASSMSGDELVEEALREEAAARLRLSQLQGSVACPSPTPLPPHPGRLQPYYCWQALQKLKIVQQSLSSFIYDHP